MSVLLALLGVAVAAPVDVVLRERGTGDEVADAWVLTPTGRVDAVAGVVHLDLPDGTHELTAMTPLHAPTPFRVEVPRDTEVRVFLRADLPPLEVVVEARRPSPHASRQILDRERVLQTPGAFNDPFRLIQSLPGVAVTREFGPSVGQVAIRGAAPAESRFFVDGIELPYLYHFDQYASVVPTHSLDEVAVYPSAFGPAYGDAVGGIVAADTLPAEGDRIHGGADVNFIMAGGHLSVPASDTVTVGVSARRSYLDLASSSNDQYTVWPVFYDLTGRVDWKPTADQHHRIVVLGAGDSYGRYAGDTALLDPLEASQEAVFDSDRDFQAVLVETDFRADRARAESVVGLVHDGWAGSLADASQLRDELRVSLRHTQTLLLGAHELVFGVDGHQQTVSLDVQTDRAWPEVGQEAPLLERGVGLDERRGRLHGGLWAEPRLVAGPATIQPGLRLQGDTSVTGLPGLDPRLTVQLAMPGELRLRAGGGRYHQAPPLDAQALRAAAGQPELGWTRAEHAVLGADWAVAGRWELGLEGWARWQHDAVVDDPDDGLSVEEGRAVGLELTSRYRLRERFFSWASVSLGRARRGGQVSPWDQPYAFNLVTSWDFLPGWNVGLRWRYAAGTPYTQVVDGIYDGDQDRYLPVDGEPYGARMADYQKVDLHLQRDFDLRAGRISLYFELWWVPAANNTLYPVYSFDYSEQAFVVGPPLVPLLGARADL
ncbi:MAG: TonB-dependent receptor plug domain-containing protein [Alphaproteobacteria bacterium]|nr:TonB-dependent receptor plug domain-containing protein [Alphaproteobacteria bacterium]